jgi:predicted nucleic acid-binding protein
LSKNPEQINFDADKFSLDSSAIIAFFNSDLKHILSGVFKNEIYFSSEIIKEIQSYDLSIFNFEILNLKNPNEFEYFINISKSNPGLSVADVHLISISKFNNLVCVSFEKKVRKICKDYGIKNIGLMQILNEALRIFLIDKEGAKKIVKSLINNGMYLSNEIYNEILKNFGNTGG